MNDSLMMLYMLRLIAGGIAAFCAVLLWTHTRDLAWTCLLGGIVLNYGGTIYSVLTEMNVIASDFLSIGKVPLTAIIFAVIPSLLVTSGIVLMLLRRRK